MQLATEVQSDLQKSMINNKVLQDRGVYRGAVEIRRQTT